MKTLTSGALRLLCFAGIISGSLARGQDTHTDYPPIRAVTAFIHVDKGTYTAQIDEAAQFLSVAQAAFHQAGFSGAAGRVTTQPFPQYIKGLKRDEAISLIKSLSQVAVRDHVRLNIGPAMSNDDDDTTAAVLLPSVLGEGKVYASLVVADEKGIHWNAVKVASHVIHELGATTRDGNGNFYFAASAMIKPYGPYYPSSWHDGPGMHFAIAMETANVVERVFQRYHDPVEAQAHLTEELSRYALEAEAVAKKLAADKGWTYDGLDATPAPSDQYSIGSAFESYLQAPIGSYGSMTAAGIITRAVQGTPVKRTGYSGLMIPVMEDKVLAQRWSEGTYSLDSILSWSSVCAAGVDTVPLAGGTSEDQIARIIGDVSWLAFKWNKPLGVRLMVATGKGTGDMTAFTADGIVNTRLH
jgi:uncharacterized protein (UPF0210 family)